MKKKIVVVVGATASGKTSLGINICKKFDGEVVSADSMQIYKGMNIATAKPTLEETDGIPHHLIDFLDVTNKYSVSSYCEDAKAVIDDIISRNKLPVIVGGTGLYIDSLINNTEFLQDASSNEVREQLKDELNTKGIDALYSELVRIDPEAAKNIHKNNTVRVLRALEIFRSTGKTLTEQNRLSHIIESDYEPLFVGIAYKDRNILYNRINKRVDIMMENGLLNEAIEFYKSNPSDTAVNAIGYKELKPFIDGRLPLEECVDNLKKETRHYAKRQITWFKRNSKINWVYNDELETEKLLLSVCEIINDFLKG
ncbi:MAG: tRNA (adenosine(37)-N6)-dimethylallyltransferase MiaA [Acutalibacteraceae bacterium]